MTCLRGLTFAWCEEGVVISRCRTWVIVSSRAQQRIGCGRGLRSLKHTAQRMGALQDHAGGTAVAATFVASDAVASWRHSCREAKGSRARHAS
eukprot:6186559-Pleurochrysis_carterae.AAC.15